MASAATAAHDYITTLELPPTLHCFRLMAPQFIKGGGYQTIHLTCSAERAE
jgi:hypothetical protein